MSVKAGDFALEMGTEVTSLLALKEYRIGCLTPCNQIAFDLLLSAEITFRQCEESFLSSTRDIRLLLLDEILTQNLEINLPECHNINKTNLPLYLCTIAILCYKAKKFENRESCTKVMS
jgi:hypothetical protein